MKRTVRLFISAVVCTVCIGGFFYVYAQDNPPDAVEILIKDAKEYLNEDNVEKSIEMLDSAFKLAEEKGNHEALMEIGDLYITVDPTLHDKALEAWTAAGRVQCR